MFYSLNPYFSRDCCRGLVGARELLGIEIVKWEGLSSQIRNSVDHDLLHPEVLIMCLFNYVGLKLLMSY